MKAGEKIKLTFWLKENEKKALNNTLPRLMRIAEKDLGFSVKESTLALYRRSLYPEKYAMPKLQHPKGDDEQETICVLKNKISEIEKKWNDGDSKHKNLLSLFCSMADNMNNLGKRIDDIERTLHLGPLAEGE